MTLRVNVRLIMLFVLSLLLWGTVGAVYADQVSVTTSGKVVSIFPGEPRRFNFLLLQPLEIVKSFVLVKDRGANLVYCKVVNWDVARKTLSLELIRKYNPKSTVELSKNYDLVLRIEDRPEVKPEPIRAAAPAEVMVWARSAKRSFVELSYGDPISEQFLNAHIGYHVLPYLSAYFAYGYYSQTTSRGTASLSDMVLGVRVMFSKEAFTPFVGVNTNFVKISTQSQTHSASPLGVAFGGEWQGSRGIRVGAGYSLYALRGTLTESAWPSSALSLRFGWAL